MYPSCVSFSFPFFLLVFPSPSPFVLLVFPSPSPSPFWCFLLLPLLPSCVPFRVHSKVEENMILQLLLCFRSVSMSCFALCEQPDISSRSPSCFPCLSGLLSVSWELLGSSKTKDSCMNLFASCENIWNLGSKKGLQSKDSCMILCAGG